MEKGKEEERCIVHNNLQLRQGKYFKINILSQYSKYPMKPVKQKPEC